MKLKYTLPDGVYDVLKWIGLIACPALATFYGVVAPLWGWPAPESVVTTINGWRADRRSHWLQRDYR